MKSAVYAFIIIVAGIHLFFMWSEVYPFDYPTLLKSLEGRLGFTNGQGRHATAIVMNAGLFNGLVAAGLLWSFTRKESAFDIRICLLTFAVVAGLFGALTLPMANFGGFDFPVTLILQALPAAIALFLTIQFQSSTCSGTDEPALIKFESGGR